MLFALLALAVFAVEAVARQHDPTWQPDHVLRLSVTEAAHACRWRQSVVVNGISPGPLIQLYENQTSWIRVYNDMEHENATIHWHGLTQSTAPFSDGSPVVSQWPIPPSHFYDYELRPNVGEAGTYFYHSHVNFQAVSAAGPLVVSEKGRAPPYSYDEEKIMILTELYNKTDQQIVNGLSQPLQSFIWSGYPEAVLVNGNSFPATGTDMSKTLPPFSFPPSGLPEPSCEPEVFFVRPGTTYRYRTIGAGALAAVVFAIEEHTDLDIISADGSYSKPARTDYMQVNSGQRFDFLLRTKSREEIQQLQRTTFWVQLETRYQPVTTTSYAVLQYIECDDIIRPRETLEAPTKRPLTLPSQTQDWMEYQLHPATPGDFPQASSVDRVVVINSSLVGGIPVTTVAHWSANNRTWTEDNQSTYPQPHEPPMKYTEPYLVQIFKYGDAAIPNFDQAVMTNGYDRERNTYVAKVGEIIDIVLQNQPGTQGFYDAHPWHAHGGHFWDLGSGPGTYDPIANEERIGGVEPMIRDTTTLYSYPQNETAFPAYTNQGWRAWRIRVKYPGVWMIHCHTLQHMVLGMQTVWIMGNASEITNSRPQDFQAYLQFGGAVYGNSTHNPDVIHFYDSG